MMSSQAGGQGHPVNSQQSVLNSSNLHPIFPVSSGIPTVFNTTMTPASLASTPFPLFSMSPPASVQSSMPPSSASPGRLDSLPTESNNRNSLGHISQGHTVGPMPPVMPIPLLPPHFPPGPADLLPVDPYLPCHSRHFLARRTANAASHTNVVRQVMMPVGAKLRCATVHK